MEFRRQETVVKRQFVRHPGLEPGSRFPASRKLGAPDQVRSDKCNVRNWPSADIILNPRSVKPNRQTPYRTLKE
jgi:hypothetical protein